MPVGVAHSSAVHVTSSFLPKQTPCITVWSYEMGPTGESQSQNAGQGLGGRWGWWREYGSGDTCFHADANGHAAMVIFDVEHLSAGYKAVRECLEPYWWRVGG